MREILLVTGMIMVALALRSCRTCAARRVGILVLLVASFCVGYFFTGCVWVGFLAAGVWLLLPWLPLLTTVRKLRLPWQNRLLPAPPPDEEYFPEAEAITQGILEVGFEHAADAAWHWQEMQQHLTLYWHPEERAVAILHQCEQRRVTFTYLAVVSRGQDGVCYRTTNFPFSPTLAHSPYLKENGVSCRVCCFHRLMERHRVFLRRHGVELDGLLIPDPDDLPGCLERETREVLEYNLQRGLIAREGELYFRYTLRGLLFLWRQYLIDMIRLA